MSNISVLGIGLFIVGFFIALILLGVVATIIFFAVRKKPTPKSYQPPKPEQQEMIKTLGETIKDLRQSRNMTQEFVAESLGVSRQAVSKWENGTSEPGTSNLVAIAKLFEVEPEELLKKLIK